MGLKRNKDQSAYNDVLFFFGGEGQPVVEDLLRSAQKGAFLHRFFRFCLPPECKVEAIKMYIS